MTAIIVLALLASNIFLAKMLLTKEDKKEADAQTKAAESPPDEEKAEAAPDVAPPKSEQAEIEDKIASVVGASKYDPDSYRNVVKEIVKEVVPLILEEYGNFADAGLPETSADQTAPNNGVVPNDKLDDVFSNKTASELTGEEPEPAEPRAEGVDFDSLNTTMKVLKDKSDKPEDVATAQETLRELEDTVIKEKLSFDPAIQKKILLVELYVPEEPQQATVEDTPDPSPKEDAATKKPKKLLFHADIDTTDIDGIDFNVFH